MAYEIDNKEWIQAIYVAYFGRPGDPTGLSYWLTQFNNGVLDLVGIADNFAMSQEAQAEYAYFYAAYNYPALITDQMRQDFIKKVYQNVFERDPDAQGLQYWTDLLKNAQTPGAFIAHILYTAYQGRDGTGQTATDWKTVYNKIQVAEYFTDYLVANNIPWTMALSDQVEAVLETVTATSDVNAVNQQVEDIIEGQGQTGQTFVLTKGIDSYNTGNNKATAGNDTYIGAIDNTNSESNTLNTGDNIDGGGGDDTLDLTVAGNGFATWPTVTLKSIEAFKVKQSAALATPIDLANFDNALKTIESRQSAANVIFDNALKTQSFTLKDITTTGLTTDINFKSGELSGSSDAISLTLNNVTSAAGTSHTVNLDGGAANQGVETVNLKVEGGNATLAALNVRDNGVATTLKKLVITGDKNLTINATGPIDFAGGAGEIDASAFTGKLTINALDAGNDDVTFKGGKGDDTILFGGTLTATDSVDGGDGKDTLGANTFAALQAAFNANRVANFEVLRLQQALSGGTLDVSKAGNISEIVLSGGIGAAATTIDKLATDATFTIGANGTGTLTANLKDASLAGTQNTLTLNLGSATDAGPLNVGTITAAGVETVNIAALGQAQNTNLINTLTLTANSDLKKVVVTGNEGLKLTAGTGITEYDASASKGVQDTTLITFSNAGAVIKGGSEADTLEGDGGNDTIIGGAGDDTLIGAMGSDVLEGGDGADTYRMSDNGNNVNLTNPIIDTIKGFQLGSGGDKLDFSALANNLKPVLDGTVSVYKVESLTSGLPAGGSAGRAEVLVLDSSVASLQAANASALNNKVFNLGGTAGYGQVIVVYSDSANGHARVATATIAGNDITNIVDMAVLENVTTAQFFSGFHESNIDGFGTPGQTLVANAAPFNTLTGAGIIGGATAGAGNDTIQTTYALLNNAGNVIDGLGGVNTLAITDAPTAAINLQALFTTPMANISIINLEAGSATNLVTAPNLAGLTIQNTHASNAAQVALGNVAQTYNGGAGVDTVTIGANNQTVNGGAGDDEIQVGAIYTGVVIDGGAGTDTLKMTGAGNITGLTLNSVETLDINGKNTTIGAAQFNAFTTVNDTGGPATITFADNGAVTHGAGSAKNFALAAGGQSFTGNVDVAYTITGGAGDDTITIGAGNTKDVSIDGGGGDDTINMTDGLAVADTIDGGLGNDTLILTGNASGSNKVTGIETILVNYTTAAATFTTGAITPGVASTIDASGSTKNVTLDASAYVANTSLLIKDGQGNDTITVSGTDAQRLLTTVNLATGGNDTVVIDNAVMNNGTSSAVTIQNFGSTDKLQIKLAGSAVSDGAFTSEYTGAAPAALADNSVLEIDANTVTFGTLTNAAAVLAWLNSKTVTAAAANGEAVIVAYNGAGQAGIYIVDETGGAPGAFDEIELVAIVNIANNAFVATNFM